MDQVTYFLSSVIIYPHLGIILTLNLTSLLHIIILILILQTGTPTNTLLETCVSKTDLIIALFFNNTNNSTKIRCSSFSQFLFFSSSFIHPDTFSISSYCGHIKFAFLQITIIQKEHSYPTCPVGPGQVLLETVLPAGAALKKKNTDLYLKAECEMKLLVKMDGFSSVLDTAL